MAARRPAVPRGRVSPLGQRLVVVISTPLISRPEKGPVRRPAMQTDMGAAEKGPPSLTS